MTRSLLALVSAVWFASLRCRRPRPTAASPEPSVTRRGSPSPASPSRSPDPPASRSPSPTARGPTASSPWPQAPTRCGSSSRASAPSTSPTSPSPPPRRRPLDATLEIALVESVTVTAQKREENLQSVPVAITALTEQTIERTRHRRHHPTAVHRPGHQCRPGWRGHPARHPRGPHRAGRRDQRPRGGVPRGRPLQGPPVQGHQRVRRCGTDRGDARPPGHALRPEYVWWQRRSDQQAPCQPLRHGRGRHAGRLMRSERSPGS